jgi:hypothetical protein
MSSIKINKDSYGILRDSISNKLSDQLYVSPNLYLDNLLGSLLYIKLEREVYSNLYTQLSKQLGDPLMFQVIDKNKSEK